MPKRKNLSSDERGDRAWNRARQQRLFSSVGQEIRRRAEAGEKFDTPESQCFLEDAGFFREGNEIRPHPADYGPCRPMTEIPLVNPDTGEVVLRISIDGDVEVVDCRSDVPRVIASGLLLGTAPDMIVPYLWAFDIAAHPDDAMADMRLKFASIQNEGVARGLIDAPKAARYAGDERAAEAMWAYLGMRADLGRNPKVVEVARRLGWKRTTTADRLRRGVELFRSGGDEDREDEIQRLLDEQRSDDASTIARGTSRAGDASERAWVEETDEPGLDHLLDLAWPTEGPEAD